MSNIEKINLVFKKANISKVNLAKYLGVSRQMVYNYLDSEDLVNVPADKCQLILDLLEIKDVKDMAKKEITPDYINLVSSKIFSSKKVATKKSETIELVGLKKEEQEIISDIVFLIKEMFSEDRTKTTLTTITYFYHFLQSLNNTKELKYILGYVTKASGFIKPNVYDFEEENQYVFESIMYSAMTLYANGGASRTKLAESHKRWEAELQRKNEEKLSRTQELNTAKVQALKELGYTEITEKNAGEVFDKIAEIQSRKI